MNQKQIENILYNRLGFMSDEPYPLVTFSNEIAFNIVVENLTENILTLIDKEKGERTMKNKKCFKHKNKEATYKRLNVLKNSNKWIYICEDCASFLMQSPKIAKGLKLQKI